MFLVKREETEANRLVMNKTEKELVSLLDAIENDMKVARLTSVCVEDKMD